MYVTKVDLTLRTTRAVEFQRQNERRVEALRSQSGFIGSLVLNSLGYPVMQMSPMYFHTTKFVVLLQWESAAAADTCFASAAWQEFAEAHRSEQLFTPQVPVERYETLQRLGRVVDRAPFAWLVTVDGGNEGDLRALCERYRDRLAPFVESRLLGDLDTPGRYVAVLLLTGQTEFPPGQAVPAIEQFRLERFPDNATTGQLVPEGFQVVHLVETA